MDSAASSTFRVALISMPWSIFNRPSVQLGSLKAYIEQDSAIKVDTYHPYLYAAKAIGTDIYGYISQKTWAGEALYASQLFPEMEGQAERLFRKRCSDKKGKQLNFINLSQQLEHALSEWLGSLNLSRYNLLGFSICFSQLLPTLAAAAKIKEIRGDIPIVVGGSSCGSGLGPSLIRTFPQFDYVIDGEGENPLLKLCHFLSHRCNSFPSQIKSRNPHDGARPCAPIKDINELPIPDYRPYFKELHHLFPGLPFLPVIPLEFSRGCWWNKCAFCNLNIQWQGYRWKKGSRMLQELEHHATSYKCLDFSFTDNALPPKEADHFFQVLTDFDYDFRFFAEIRTINDWEKLALYRHGGLDRVQVGIEALSASLLKKLKKGTSVIENIATMKYCVENNIQLEGNLIIQFPGSTEDEVAETLDNLNYVLPFSPLSSAAFFLGMGSPVECDPKKYGLQAVTHHADNKKLFPAHLLRNMKLLTMDYRGDKALQKRIWQPVIKRIQEWQDFHLQRKDKNSPPLCFRDGGSFLVIRQETMAGETLLHRLQGKSRELYLFCTTIKSLDDIHKEFTGLPEKTILNFFDDLCKKRLFFQERDTYLALAIRSSKPE